MRSEWLVDWNFWRTVVEVVAVMGAGFAAALAWWRRRQGNVTRNIKGGDEAVMKSLDSFRTANRGKFERVHQRLDEFGHELNDHGMRLTKVEERVQSLPRHSDLRTIYGQLAKLEAAVAESVAASRQHTELLTTINTYLIQREDRS